MRGCAAHDVDVGSLQVCATFLCMMPMQHQSRRARLRLLAVQRRGAALGCVWSLHPRAQDTYNRLQLQASGRASIKLKTLVTDPGFATSCALRLR